jgi:hypothetical protein
MSRRTKILITAGVSLIVLLPIALYWLVHISVTEFYSSYQTTFSIADSKKVGLFVSQSNIEKPIVELNGYKYPIKEIWIEQATRVEYKWLLFRKRIPTGYRLMATLSVPYESAEDENLTKTWDKALFCNDTIKLSSVIAGASDNRWLYYGDVAPPFPQQVRLTFKDK